MLVVCVCGLLHPHTLWADSLRLMTDLDYRMTNNTTTTKATGVKREIDREIFTQIYNLDVIKELRPNLTLNGGGIFKDDYSQSEVDGDDSDRRTISMRPYVGLQLSTPIIKSALDYRTSELKESGYPGPPTTRRYVDEYSGRLNWRPVELPEVDFFYTNTHGYNEPATPQGKRDKESDSYQLRSKYDYQNYRFDYNHQTTESRDKVSNSETTANTDIGSVRYSDSFQGDRFTLNANTRLKRDKLEFRGDADRLVPTSSTGRSFYNLDDPSPLFNNDGDFDEPPPLANVNLLQDGAPQLSFGLDFTIATEVDTIYVELLQDDPLNNQASPSEVDSIKNLYSWSVYVSDNQRNWTERAITQNNFEVFENRFEISFVSARERYVKIAVTPLPTILVPGKEIRVSRLTSFRTLPPDTSTFTTTDWTTDLGLNWKMSERTTSNFNILYREERTDPFDGKRTLLSTNASLNHRFDSVFSGSTRLLRSHVTERGEADRTGHTFSASMGANYLDTFDQTLTYSFTHNEDRDEGTDISNSLLLRNNLYLYDGWSMTFDSGYSWKDPADGENSNFSFVRVENSIIPNRWMNFTLYGEMSWDREDNAPTTRQETGRLVASWVPTAALSLRADILIDHETGRSEGSSTVQQYSVNWSPFRDGTLQFSLLYAMTDDSEGQDVWTVSPTARWQINKKTLLTLDYSIGEREDDIEKTEFDTVRVVLRFFY